MPLVDWFTTFSTEAWAARTLFDKDGDYLAFERVLEETLRTRPMRVCAYCLLSTHWHFVLWPEHDGDLAAFMQQMTNTHVKRWKEHRHEIGYGHLYQERYKSFPVETEEYFYQVVRYVERNALRANLVTFAESWRWSSLRRGEREDPAFPSFPRGRWRGPPTGCGSSINRRARRIAGVVPVRAARLPLRQSRMGRGDSEAPRARIDAPAAWEGRERSCSRYSAASIHYVIHIIQIW